jgi:general secretion pathway protein A
MDYFKILNLNREPFSNSPDPDYFYHSQQHLDCLQKLELSLHLRRGLNVIIGDVGTGKTTLCRQLIRRFAQRKEMETHLILDPAFKNSNDFLATVAKLLSGKPPLEGTTDWQIKEFIKHYLFRKGVDQKKTTMLIIDEGQKIPVFCLELLREFLNYETNEYKLLQIVIFAQKEFEAVIGQHPNFADRINLYHQLRPLSFQDTRMMVKYRLEKSSNTSQKLDLFTLPALVAIYFVTKGYPRKIINLCHQCILAMIIQNKSKVRYQLVHRCSTRVFSSAAGLRRRLPAAALASGVLVAVLLWVGSGDRLASLKLGMSSLRGDNPARQQAVVTPALLPDTKPPSAPVREPAQPPPTPAMPPAAAASATVPARETLPALSAEDTRPAQDVAMLSPAPAVPQPVDMLGILSLKRNETISGLIQKVYGNYSNKNFRVIMLANPHIEDPDRVEVGQMINLPAIPIDVTAPDRNVWWVKIDESASLQSAFDLVRNYAESGPPVRLIPLWRPDLGMRFAVILKQVFSSADAARLQLRRIPTVLASSSRVLDSWGHGTVFFADPYYVK